MAEDETEEDEDETNANMTWFPRKITDLDDFLRVFYSTKAVIGMKNVFVVTFVKGNFLEKLNLICM